MNTLRLLPLSRTLKYHLIYCSRGIMFFRSLQTWMDWMDVADGFGRHEVDLLISWLAGCRRYPSCRRSISPARPPQPSLLLFHPSLSLIRSAPSPLPSPINVHCRKGSHIIRWAKIMAAQVEGRVEERMAIRDEISLSSSAIISDNARSDPALDSSPRLRK